MYNQKYRKQYYLRHKKEIQKKYYKSKRRCPSCGNLMTKRAKQCHKCFLSKNNPSQNPEVRKKIAESKKGLKNPSWKGGKAKVRCAFCKKILKRWRGVKKHNKSGLFFCNKNCRAEYEKKSRIDKKGPNYKHGRYSKLRICLTCGKNFYKARGKTKYCSQRCRPKPGYLYVKGRRFEYKAISVLKKMGFQIIFRSPRSRGMFDLFALKGNSSTKKIVEARYIQVKASRSSFPLKSIVPRKEREEIIKNKTVIMIGKNTFYEIWVRRLNKKWDVYRLNWGSKEFELQ